MVQFRATSSASFRSRDVDVSASMTITIGFPEPRERRVRSRDHLRAELATYRTAAERRDIEAILDRYEDHETCEIRSILAERISPPG